MASSRTRGIPVEIDEFETTDPELRGEMKITVTLADAEAGTQVTGLHEGLPPGVSLADNAATQQPV
jgi:hypothetical protein